MPCGLIIKKCRDSLSQERHQELELRDLSERDVPRVERRVFADSA